MKWCALALLAAGLCFGGKAPAADPVRTFTGIVHDNRCVGPNCATQCPSDKRPKYTLQSGDEAWVLSDQKNPARYVGAKVIVTGRVAGNTLQVASITPAR